MHRNVTSAVVVAGISLGSVQLAISAEPAVAAARPNLLLITLDTVRADHLSCNGSQRVQTPHLDRLALDGVNFTRARTSVPLTLPAHASIMTGSYPPLHGIRDNGSFRLPEDQSTLAEVLAGHGYETAAFIGAFVLDREFGLAQGFEVYNEGDWRGAHRMENLAAERRADAVRDAFSKWLEGRTDERPFFAWIHFYDPHAPYDPPEPFRTRYAGDPYSGEIASTDAVVGSIVEDLESRRLLASTLIAVVGDHGEGLGEHGEQTHSLLIYNSTIHVPMLLHFPQSIPAGKTVDHLSRTIDLASTILDYLGFAQNFGQGLSLRPLVDGKALDEEISAYSESLYPSLNLGWSELRALESDRHRFILAPRSELYDLSKDPGETENRIESSPEIGARLKGRLESLMESMPGSVTEARRAVDPGTHEMLRSLGYVSGGRSSPRGNSDVVDPKDHMGLWTQIELGLALFNRGNDAGALEIFTRALAKNSDIPILYDHIGWSYIRLNHYDRAEKVYRRAIESGFDSAEIRANLGLIYFRWGEFEKAEHELQTALQFDEDSITAHYRLADVYRASKEYVEAVAHYRRVLEIDPDYVWALNGLGMVLAREGKNEEALAAFRDVVRIDPEMAPAYLNLAIHLERMKRFPEALDAYQRFMELSSEKEFSHQREIAAAAIERLQAR
jgi:arylsulfatase A-like enzyme/Tfp pilus assembly protein PilF